jgi:hypothetical protein
MYYVIYKITNILNNKIYIGYHSTKNLDDDYMGSGKGIRLAIQKYGITNFKKEILYVFPTKIEALCIEKELVNAEFIAREDTYNIKLGGEGGWDHTIDDPKRIEAVKQAFVNGNNKGWQQAFDTRSKISKSAFKGKRHTDNSKKLIGAAARLNETERTRRLIEYNLIEKSWGWITKLSKSWGVTNTQVQKYIKHNMGI